MFPGKESVRGCRVILLSFISMILLKVISVTIVEADSLQSDKQVLLSFKSFLEHHNRVNRGAYTRWNIEAPNPCNWTGISCNTRINRVTGINLSNNSIAGEIYGNLSALTELTYLDLSQNTLSVQIPTSLNECRKLKFLNLSHNIIQGQLKLSGLDNLETLDLSLNRIQGGIENSFPSLCRKLRVLNISTNNFTGSIDNCFDRCQNLEELDLSSNNFTGKLWSGFTRLRILSLSENYFSGSLQASFSINGSNNPCNLQIFDLSENQFSAEVPGQISSCRNLSILNLWGNNFSGRIPDSLGSVSSLAALILGNNSFSREVPESLLNCSNLVLLDLSGNKFGGNIPPIFGKFTQVKYLVLHNNSFTGGLYSSGIMNLPKISRLDLSFNSFSGPLPTDMSKMATMQFLVLAYNQFSGPIPPEYGSLHNLQALDLSFNRLTGSIPPQLGNLTSLLWLMLANNSLTGQIPPELGNCSSLLWLNLADNQLSGQIPAELTNIGTNPMPTFLSNRNGDRIHPGTGECLTMRRWIPANYPPFSFVYTLLTMKSCRTVWEQILEGHGLFPICLPSTNFRTFMISGYLQFSGNRFSGPLPPQIGKMQNFSMLHFGFNHFSGSLPPDIAQMPLVVLNVSKNNFSGVIPEQIGNVRCLENLDLSYNNFSGIFPASLNNLTELNKFNVSFNPLLSGEIPSTGQLATFEKESFFGDPLLLLPSFLNDYVHAPPKTSRLPVKHPRFGKIALNFVYLSLIFAFIVSGAFSMLVCRRVKHPADASDTPYLLNDEKFQHGYVSSSCTASSSSPWFSNTVKVIQLDKTTFTHDDILKATNNFSEDRVIGKGGFGTVYRGVLPDGRKVAVKKLQRKGTEGEREFRAEMEVLSGNGICWPHPNLVTLYGWCLDRSEKILVYEYMEGGSLEDRISDPTKLTWRKRIAVAIDIAQALVFLHHECDPSIVHRDVKASNVLLDQNEKARVTDFGLARVVDVGDSHVSTTIAGTVGYVAPEYGQTWQATTKGDVYSFGVLAMELATGRRALDGGEECLVEWASRLVGNGQLGVSAKVIPGVLITGSGLTQGAEEMCDLLLIGIKCTAESPQARPDMKEVLSMLIKVLGCEIDSSHGSLPAS